MSVCAVFLSQLWENTLAGSQDSESLKKQVESLRETNTELQEKVHLLELIVQISTLPVATVDKEQTLASLNLFFRDNILCDAFAVLLKVDPAAPYNVITCDGFDLQSGRELTRREENGISRTLQNSDNVCLADLSAAAAPPMFARDSGSMLLLPMLIGGVKRSGLLVLWRQKPNAFPAKETGRLETVAMHVALVLDKTLLFHTTRELAYSDGLTGIFNRRYFDQRYLREFLRAKRYKRSLAVLMIDIDHFKKYNDALGHLLGDVALRKVAAVLEKNLRRADIACRYGGEEFVVLLPESDSSHAVMAAEKLRRAVLKVDFEGEDKMPDGVVSVSIGVAAYPEHGEDAGVLLNQADKGLYEAKRRGRNRVVLMDEEEAESA